MKITIKSTGFELTPSIKTYIEKKLGGIEKFVKKMDAEGAVEMKVEVARTTKHHKHGDVFSAEANLKVPGSLLRATHEDADVHTAIDRVEIILRGEIDKLKTKKSPKAQARKASVVRKK